MIFVSVGLVLLFSALKAFSVIDWHWLIIIAPVILDALTIGGAKVLGRQSYLDLMLCHPLRIKSVMRSRMVRRAS